METLLLEWKVERTLLIEWPNGGQEIATQSRVIRMSKDDPEPHIVVNERGDAFVSMFPPASAEKQQKLKQVSMLEKETQMDMEPESQLDEHQDNVTQESSSSSSGRKYDSEEAEMTLAESMELEVCLLHLFSCNLLHDLVGS